MKREMNNKKYILPLLVITTLIVSIFLVSAVEPNSINTGAWNWVKGIYEDYILPSDSVDYFSGFSNPNILAIVTIIGLIVFSSIIFEISSLLPLSMFTNIIIGTGALIILIATKIMRTIITYLMLFIVTATGAGGIFGMIMVGVIFLVLAIATFTGANWAHTWVDRIRYNRDMSRMTRKAYKAAANVTALNTEGAAVKYK